MYILPFFFSPPVFSVVLGLGPVRDDAVAQELAIKGFWRIGLLSKILKLLVACDCVGAHFSDTVFQFAGLSVQVLISFLVQIVLVMSCEFSPVQHILLLSRLGAAQQSEVVLKPT